MDSREKKIEVGCWVGEVGGKSGARCGSCSALGIRCRVGTYRLQVTRLSSVACAEHLMRPAIFKHNDYNSHLLIEVDCK